MAQVIPATAGVAATIGVLITLMFAIVCAEVTAEERRHHKHRWRRLHTPKATCCDKLEKFCLWHENAMFVIPGGPSDRYPLTQ